MKVSYDWLNTFFDGKLPQPEVIARELTFHAWEIEEVLEKNGDTVLDLKVLPDKSAWALSHRGVAKDISVVLNIPLAQDPFSQPIELLLKTDRVKVEVATLKCARYAAAYVKDIQVGPSPEWLKKRLEVIGQRSINNVVDATNYVMFELGQPLHAFDAKKLEGEQKTIVVRDAQDGEKITSLTGEEYTLTPDDMVITDGANRMPLGIAGIKGGKVAEVDQNTTDIIIESANFDSISVRKTAQRLKLRTDASQRFENGIVPEVVPYALVRVVELIKEIAGGTLEGYTETPFTSRPLVPVKLTHTKLERVLGISIPNDAVRGILERFGYKYEIAGNEYTVTPPFERIDITIPEDLIEEIGRVYGYEHVISTVPEPIPLSEINVRFYYAERVRDVLLGLGFSEVFTSSFRNTDEVHLQNALATDKEYLRSSLVPNMNEALARNVPNKDLLGLAAIQQFEIGTVFHKGGEKYLVALGIRTGQTYSEKKDKPLLDAALTAIATTLGVSDLKASIKDGVAEFDLGALLEILPVPTKYEPFVKKEDTLYKPFSLYPFVLRDIALWVSEGVTKEEVEQTIKTAAGDLLTRITLFDEFKKEGKVSYAFHLVFQSYEKTLTDAEVSAAMEQVLAAVGSRGWEVR